MIKNLSFWPLELKSANKATIRDYSRYLGVPQYKVDIVGFD